MKHLSKHPLSFSTTTFSLISLLCLFLLSGCAGFGVLATNSPMERARQASFLMDQNRAWLSEKLLHDNLKQFANQPHPKVSELAYTYFILGHLYKHESYHHGKFTEGFKQDGTFDGTYQRSIDNFRIAKRYYKQAGDQIGVVNSIIGIASAYGFRYDNVTACKYYKKALAHYRTFKEKGILGKDPYKTPYYANTEELIEAVLVELKCP